MAKMKRAAEAAASGDMDKDKRQASKITFADVARYKIADKDSAAPSDADGEDDDQRTNL